jgi:ATP:corrinoid adenosyltransferase
MRPALVGRGEQAGILQFLKHRADRGRRKIDAAGAGQRLGADGLTRGDIAFDHEPKNVARAVGQFGERGALHSNAYV